MRGDDDRVGARTDGSPSSRPRRQRSRLGALETTPRDHYFVEEHANLSPRSMSPRVANSPASPRSRKRPPHSPRAIGVMERESPSSSRELRGSRQQLALPNHSQVSVGSFRGRYLDTTGLQDDPGPQVEGGPSCWSRSEEIATAAATATASVTSPSEVEVDEETYFGQCLSRCYGHKSVTATSAFLHFWLTGAEFRRSRPSLRCLGPLGGDGDAQTAGEPVKEHWPVFTMMQSLATLLLWFVYAVQGGAFSDQAAGLESIFPGSTTLVLHTDCEDLRSQIWRWWTYQFTHHGLYHISSNLLLLIVAGIPLEVLKGSLRMWLYFTVGVIGGAFGHMVFDPHAGSNPGARGPITAEVVGLTGMSGGCYALLAMHTASLVLNWSETSYRRQVALVLLLLVAVDITLVQVSSRGAGAGGAVHAAHLGGFLAGLCIGVGVSRSVQASKLECAIRLTVWFSGFFLAIFCLLWFSQWPPRSFFDATPWCMARQVSNQTAFGNWRYHCVRCQDQTCADRWLQQRFVKLVDYKLCHDKHRWKFTER